jgi:hypothetical protein
MLGGCVKTYIPHEVVRIEIEAITEQQAEDPATRALVEA